MKVDEQFKCKDCDNYNQCNYYHNRRETSFICKEFQNQWGFIKELEKIREEIEKLEYDDFDCNLVLPAWKVYNIIDHYIEELKGGK